MQEKAESDSEDSDTRQNERLKRSNSLDSSYDMTEDRDCEDGTESKKNQREILTKQRRIELTSREQ